MAQLEGLQANLYQTSDVEKLIEFAEKIIAILCIWQMRRVTLNPRHF